MWQFAKRFGACWGALLLAAVLGCGSTAQSQLTRCQEEKRQLLSRVVDEQKRAESLTADLRASNQRLAEAEKQLARVYDGRGRFASSAGVGAPTVATPSVGVAAAPTVTREIQLGAPRDARPLSSRTTDSGLEIVAPKNANGDSGWVPKNPSRRVAGP